jgi:hypothetical protein
MFNVAQRGGCSAGVAQQRTVLKALLKGRQAHALSAIFLTALCCSVPLWRRLAWVVGFTMGPFGTLERPWKPFNPVSSIQAARGQQRRPQQQPGCGSRRSRIGCGSRRSSSGS